jgi:lipopolysaccharide/colanic/teichoic acid biosynthesis glycosyltransferase
MEIGKKTVGFTDYLPWGRYKSRADNSSRPLRIDPLFIKKIPVWKRAFDIVGSFCALVLLFPLFLIVGIYIKAVSPGPIFFKQKRVGCGGTSFELYKFRTMKLNADASIHKQYLTKLINSSQNSRDPGVPMEKLHKDPRIIPFGSLFRASGLDELPQLINVLVGQMSLVGPRPPIFYEVEQYRLWHKGRFDIMPGLTGLWQISGKNKLGFNEMIRLDIQYAKKCSFLLDLKILFKTPYTVYQQLNEMKKGRK